MPLYEYQCQQCTNGFTELRRSSDMDTQLIALNAAAGKQYVLSVLLQLADQCREFLRSQHHHQEVHSVEQADERTGQSV